MFNCAYSASTYHYIIEASADTSMLTHRCNTYHTNHTNNESVQTPKHTKPTLNTEKTH